MIHTGSEDELRIRDTVWRDIAPKELRGTTLLAVGLAGTYVETIARVDSVRLGDGRIDDVIVQLANSGVDDGLDGSIGMGVLRRFSFFLDPGAGVFRLAAPPTPVRPRRETMAGIQGLPADDGLLIQHVMANSPAESAGLKTGDRICSVDGQAVASAWVGTPRNNWMLGPEGKAVTLGRCGGGEVRLVLRRFY